MSIFNHFTGLSLSAGQVNALAKIELFLENKNQIFLLKGYAGTGKTTILKGLVNYLASQQLPTDVVAPTGRAAKVLRDKTNHGATIHKGIYNFNSLNLIKAESTDFAEKSFHFQFPIADFSEPRRVVIVDEASMISNVKSEHELFTFGTGKILDDLLTYSKIATTTSKIIFVGDPAQLPPFNDSKSQALDINFFTENGLLAEEAELTEVFRQPKNNLILNNATKIRNLLKEEKRASLKFDFDEETFIHLPDEIAATKYVELFPKPTVGQGVVINYTNASALSYNNSIRKKLFPENKDITAGDIILINNNNYHTYGIEMYNGDMAQVIEVLPGFETQSAPVYVTEGARKVQKIITLHFRNIKIKFPYHDSVIECKIIDTILNSPAPGLSVTESKALYINFSMRFDEIQKQRKNQGLATFKEGSEEYKQLLKSDPYFNALQIKYGYAVTCHKAQGSEWQTTFVDYRGQIGLKNAHLRWCYTALTRAKAVCFNIHSPSFDHFDKIEFKPIDKLSKIPENSIQFSSNDSTPFHQNPRHQCVVNKYFEIEQKLSDTAFTVTQINSNQYQEQYFLKYDDKSFILAGYYNVARVFKDFTLKEGDNTTGQHLLNIVNKPVKLDIDISYTPSNEAFNNLYQLVNLKLNTECITLTNIIEFVSQYFVIYYFQSKNGFGYIQFYFDSNHKFTSAFPKSTTGTDFIELVELLDQLKNYAS